MRFIKLPSISRPKNLRQTQFLMKITQFLMRFAQFLMKITQSLMKITQFLMRLGGYTLFIKNKKRKNVFKKEKRALACAVRLF